MIKLTEHLERWDLRNWVFLGMIIQLIFIFFIDFLYKIIPTYKKEEPTKISLSTDLSFIEYEEPQPITQQSSTKDLSENILETTQKTEEKINWQNAVDPTLDFTQRYAAKISVTISPEDYPDRAKRSNLGIVRVSVALYIGSDGKIKDVKIRKIESSTGNIQAFEQDFIDAVRKIFLQKAKLLNKPYQIQGEYKDFIWYTTVTFTLE
jgi:outer membrane biosynthesis protein TonB